MSESQPGPPREGAPWPPVWPRALDAEFGPPPAGEYRTSPEDFLVEECLDFAPEGQGEHLWLWVETPRLATLDMVRELARICDLPVRAIGYSGMKDRFAVTRQWLSAHLPGRDAPEGLDEALAARGVRVLSQARHPRKLKRGVHRANRFSLVVGGAAADDSRLVARWERLCARGVPNAFGPQRFGAGGRNLARAEALLARGWRKRDDRHGMLLSTTRSFLFNELLAIRQGEGSWDRLVPGDVAVLDGTASQFVVESPDADLAERAARLDLHPGGVLWGSGDSLATKAAREYEAWLTARHPALCAGLERAGVRLARRPLRVRLGEPALIREDGRVRLDFRLPRGSFATAVLRELIDHPSLTFETPEKGQ
ncbi:tRNA pseudouridine(13) synthase TruD [Billgrantia gudaonensis]|uniref:tRNA pseudouridine synthase D n=1 Tax=Billgrantia gudaonensis TaxID=376427 RepID=A0A1G8UIA7_9GAMM|nr:tRNA pseudouridine(13) synthase TruD [Halomonas gudaonensis]SDJ52875.1 tRNA pseudouridine13 synthase [Halomonas gudaonensis]